MKKIVILTSVPEGTMGDASSAIRLRQALMHENQAKGHELDIKVIMIANSSHREVLKKTFDMTYCILMDFKNELLEKLLDFNSLSLIVVYPVPYFLKPDEQKFLSHLSVPVICATEYNFDRKFHSSRQPGIKGAIYFPTGFGEEGHGVFTNISQQQGLNRNKNNEAIQEPVIESHLLKQIVELKQRFYFGYFNGTTNSTSRVTAGFFIALAASTEPDREMRIILPFQYAIKKKQIVLEDYLSQLLNHDDIKQFAGNDALLSFAFHSENKSSFFILKTSTPSKVSIEAVSEKTFHSFENSSKKIINIYDPFPLQNNIMQILMQKAEPLCLLTGDQSFIEGILAGKHICYQVMPWKEKFHDAFIKESHQWPVLRKWLLLTSSPEATLSSLSSFYAQNKKKISEACASFSQHIIKNKSLEKNFYNEVLSVLEGGFTDYFRKALASILKYPSYYTTTLRIKPDLDIFETFVKLSLQKNSPDNRQKAIDIICENSDKIEAVFSSFAIDYLLEILKKYPQIKLQIKPKHILSIIEIAPFSTMMVDSDSYEYMPRKTHDEREFIDEIEFVRLHLADSTLGLMFHSSWEQFNDQQKQRMLQLLLRAGFCGKFNPQVTDKLNKMIIDILKTEKNVEFCESWLRVLVALPYYEDREDSIFLNRRKPNLMMQLNSSASETVIKHILSNPTLIAALFKVLFVPFKSLAPDSKIPSEFLVLATEALFSSQNSPESGFFSSSNLNKLPPSLINQAQEHLQALAKNDPDLYHAMRLKLPKWLSENLSELEQSKTRHEQK